MRSPTKQQRVVALAPRAGTTKNQLFNIIVFHAKIIRIHKSKCVFRKRVIAECRLTCVHSRDQHSLHLILPDAMVSEGACYTELCHLF